MRVDSIGLYGIRPSVPQLCQKLGVMESRITSKEVPSIRSQVLPMWHPSGMEGNIRYSDRNVRIGNNGEVLESTSLLANCLSECTDG
jgi:hypothetical protein